MNPLLNRLHREGSADHEGRHTARPSLDWARPGRTGGRPRCFGNRKCPLRALFRRRSTVRYTAAFGSNPDINRELPDIAIYEYTPLAKLRFRSSVRAMKARQPSVWGTEEVRIRSEVKSSTYLARIFWGSQGEVRRRFWWRKMVESNRAQLNLSLGIAEKPAPALPPGLFCLARHACCLRRGMISCYHCAGSDAGTPQTKTLPAGKSAARRGKGGPP
jgi:hypothetical protein